MNVVKLLIILLCFMTTTVCAQDLDGINTYETIPGSYRMEYGGVYKIIVKQTSNFLENHWLERQELHYNNGYFNYPELLSRQTEISLTISEWRNGLPWYYRHWWHSLPEDKGGVSKIPRVIRKGKTIIILDLGIIDVTTAGELNCAA